MLKAMVTTETGKRVLMLGLSFGNLDRFKREPGDTYIRVLGEQMGLDLDVVIFSGRTEEELAGLVEEMVARGAPRE